ncbi:DUF4097 family beta strand repeat-containing protein [Clostridium neonatale]|uniref:DUF4097 family beta strand repeat-containing protein n=1 Tax=Clostridium neonatale TaxID=137838 RepID=UPI00291BE332|nr:DUF4097 family beta strand repeat-containing protein [Clostridium neonatale]CAI3627698.1 Conserved hypothetical protein, LiaG-like [Clostridium neonatale]CAI3630121.1 Conserved hypothetical protein, LiaG-like [Clostridium neonatale]
MKKKFMSTSIKIFLLILILLTIVFYSSGCIILVNSGYKLSDYADEINLNDFNFYYSDELGFNYKTSEKSYPINNNIKNIEISLESQNINVNEYDGDNILVEIKNNRNSNAELSKTENGDKMIFNSNHSIPSHSTVNISIPQKIIKDLSLKLTTSSGDVNLSNLNINSISTFTSSGEIYMSNVNLDYISLNSSSGDISLNNLFASDTKINSTSGEIDCIGNFGTLYSSSTSGDMNFSFTDSLKKSSFGSVSGDISLNIPTQCGYKINYYTVSGDTSFSTLSNGSEEALIDIKTTSGDISVN